MPAIQLVDVAKAFGATRAVGPVSLEVEEGEFLSLLGPSGCGKTTTLRMIAGFEEPSAGRILLRGRVANDIPVERRGIGMVFQSYALFPHLSVFENVAFGLRLRRLPERQITAKVEEALSLVGLGELGRRMPRQLSGGQQQRVSLARALAVEPAVLLLDEPLSNLDLKLREQMRDEIRRLQRKLAITAVYVTHDQSEAMALSDRIAVMNRGRIEQIGTPREIYQQPANLFVASFIGQAGFLPGRLAMGSSRFITAGGVVFIVNDTRSTSQERNLTLVIRPETVALGGDGKNQHEAIVEEVAYLGDRAVLTLRLAASGERLLAAGSAGRGSTLPQPGARVPVTIAAEDCILVEAA